MASKPGENLTTVEENLGVEFENSHNKLCGCFH